MSLRDEVERIINQERQKIETRDKLEEEFNEQQRQRFQPMSILLQELVNSIGSQYLKVNVDGSAATLKFGRMYHNPKADLSWNTDVWIPDIDWWISSNSQAYDSMDVPHRLYHAAPGFMVWEQDRYFSFSRNNPREQHFVFADETETIEYLVKIIARVIADKEHKKKKWPSVGEEES